MILVERAFTPNDPELSHDVFEALRARAGSTAAPAGVEPAERIAAAGVTAKRKLMGS